MLTDEECKTLVAILGEIDAIFGPLRTRSGNLAGNTVIARRTYGTQGLRWHHGGGDAASRMSAVRLLSLMEENDLVTLFKSKGRSSHLRLTDEGEGEARKIVGLSWPDHTMMALEKVAKLSKRKPKVFEQYWIGEDRLSGNKYGTGITRPFWDLENSLLTSLHRGWAITNSDIHGRVYYAMTAAGWDVLKDPPTFYKPQTAFDESAAAIYFNSADAARGRMTRDKTDWVGEIGQCPLPVCGNGTAIDIEELTAEVAEPQETAA